MNIDCYTITYNEEKMINFFLNHYSPFCRNITIFDNQSTDNTVNIVKSHKNISNISLYQYDSGDKLNDAIYINIKNNCWKKSNADYVIIVDCDEFLYNQNGIEKFLSDTNKKIYKPHGYDMISEKFPLGDNVFDSVKMGIPSENYSKCVMFSPKLMSEINYELGCHRCHPIDSESEIAIPSIYNDLKLLHFKNLSFNYRFERHKMYMNRFSEFNKSHGSGIHYTYDRDKQFNEFNEILKKSKTII